MSKWIEKELGKLFSYEQPYRYIVENTEYDKNSGTPVLTAGKSFVLGYTKETDNIYMDLPVVIFDDFTTDCKYVDFPFKVKSSAMKFLKSNDDNRYYLPLLFAYLETLKLSEIGEHKRQWLSEYASKTICLPEDIEEQKRIAAVLTKADELIDATQELIDKQKKIKTGLMQTLLTCGIDKNDVIRSPKTHKFKDSELGPIPEEWECVELGKCCNDIVDCPHTSPEYRNYGILVARTTNIKEGKFLIESSSRVSEDEYKKRVARLEPMAGDVIFTREAPVGESFVIPLNMKICLGQRVMLFRPNSEKVNSQYLVAYLYSKPVKEFFNSINMGLTVQHVNVKDMKKLVMLKPALDEQNKIVSLLNKQQEIIENLEFEKQKYIDIKKGLMADLLSGKVKVSA